jgi:hypothetical protein
MVGHLTDAVKTVHVLNAVAAGTTNQNTTSVDLQGFDGCRFIADIGTLTANQVTSLKVQSSTDNSNFSDITSAATANMADGDSGKTLIVDVIRPGSRYLRGVVLRATANAVINCVIAELYRLRTAPVTQDTSVSSSTKQAPAA